MERITVALEDRSYPITINAGSLYDPALFAEAIAPHQRVVIITNTLVFPLYSAALTQTLHKITSSVDHLVLPDGEKYKSLETFERIMTFLLEGNYSRDVVLVALGGGVIGDLVGFAASCYQRGVNFVQVPTTLLAQVDSSVGGKTAVNHPLGKNMIGAFYQPKAVIIDTNCLSTLPPRELSAGLAEVIKYGIIIDADFFTWLETHMPNLLALDPVILRQAIARCCQIKADVVAADERESGLRALLNLGHTFGHAIEAQMGYGVWLHGEAVAAGMVLAAQTTQLLGELPIESVERIVALLEAANLPITPPVHMTPDQFLTHMQRDKKVLAGQLRLILPINIGESVVRSDVTQEQLIEILS
jgi:3-dehydroquinate synthase